MRFDLTKKIFEEYVFKSYICSKFISKLNFLTKYTLVGRVISTLIRVTSVLTDKRQLLNSRFPKRYNTHFRQVPFLGRI